MRNRKRRSDRLIEATLVNEHKRPRIRPQDRRLPMSEGLERRVLLSSVSFSSPVATNLFTTTGTLTTLTGDLNGDTVPDLVAVHSDGTAQVFLGTATGVFTPGNFVGVNGVVATLADFNGDGNLDLATAGGVLPGNGDGTFGAALSAISLPANTVRIDAADFNGDGNADLVAELFTPASGSAAAGRQHRRDAREWQRRLRRAGRHADWIRGRRQPRRGGFRLCGLQQ